MENENVFFAVINGKKKIECNSIVFNVAVTEVYGYPKGKTGIGYQILLATIPSNKTVELISIYK
jgi:hypothetical protein